MDNTQFYIVLTFILIIINISLYYSHNSTNEAFEIENNIVKQSIQDLQTNLERFSYLDAPITINDNGNICLQWGQYNNGKYTADENKCIQLDNSDNIRKCLSPSNSITSCNKLYADGYIEKMNRINILPLIEQYKTNITNNINKFELILDNKNTELDKLINDLITQHNLELQQKNFIDYNLNNLDHKQKNINKITKNINSKQTELNVNQVEFKEFLKNNTELEKRNNTYYKITISLIILITIIIILNILFSNIL